MERVEIEGKYDHISLHTFIKFSKTKKLFFFYVLEKEAVCAMRFGRKETLVVRKQSSRCPGR